MAAFTRLDDSPMFQNQICSIEQTTDELKDRCQKLYKGCKKFMAALGEACNGDTVFAESLEAFGGGTDDPVSVSVGGPVMSKFISAFHELATYKELLRSQVEHVLIDRLTNFMTVDLQEAKDSRRRFDKAINVYDQARERFVSLKKNARGEIVAELEEDLENSKSAFEKSRFNLVNALMNVESKKKYEFLESVSSIMDAHLRYFKLGHELLSQLEPYIHQVLTYAQQSKEQTKVEEDRLAKRIQEFRTQAEMDSLRASSNLEPSSGADGLHVFGMNSYKTIEAIMQSSDLNGEIQIMKQGYLLKRSSSLRGDWKRRFFVLNSQGALFYYRSTGARPTGSHLHHFSRPADQNSGMFGRFRAKNRGASLNEDTLSCRTVDLHTSTIKLDADDTDLRLCFRIISPVKMYTLQAENEADRMDWINKITGAITSLLNSQFFDKPSNVARKLEADKSLSSGSCDSQTLDRHQSLDDDLKSNRVECVSSILRGVPGNDLCAECSAPEPDWASLNLGILLCIECSGVHRNLGVHISKVRSLRLDVKVWETTVLDLFRNLGNHFSNSIWEGLLLLENSRVDDPNAIQKPSPDDSNQLKEKYIQAKYVEKALVVRDESLADMSVRASRIWEAVNSSNLQVVYRLIVVSDVSLVNTTFDKVFDVDSHHHEAGSQESPSGQKAKQRKYVDPSSCDRIKGSNEPGNCLQGCSLLHLACHVGNLLMIELLLQSGADINQRDFHGRTPLHHCISLANNAFAKFLLRRGARPSIKDGGGLSSLERAMEKGAITDDELFILLAEAH